MKNEGGVPMRTALIGAGVIGSVHAENMLLPLFKYRKAPSTKFENLVDGGRLFELIC